MARQDPLGHMSPGGLSRLGVRSIHPAVRIPIMRYC